MRGVFLVAIAACGGGSAKPPPTLSASASPPPSVVSAEEANRVLHDDSPLDYDRPFNGGSSERVATTKLFHARCEAGDKAACIVEAQLPAQETEIKNFSVVDANCRAGDLMSCRALPIRTPQFSTSPGALSRRGDCWKGTTATSCDLTALRKECTDGYPNACSALFSWEPESPDLEALIDRWHQLTVEGCKVGIADECMYLGPKVTNAEILQRTERLCDLQRARCVDLSSAYAAMNDVMHARDAFERACQYGTPSVCLQLGASYVDGKFPEPRPGRGQALLDWACPKVREHFKGKLPTSFESMCKRTK